MFSLLLIVTIFLKYMLLMCVYFYAYYHNTKIEILIASIRVIF